MSSGDYSNIFNSRRVCLPRKLLHHSNAEPDSDSRSEKKTSVRTKNSLGSISVRSETASSFPCLPAAGSSQGCTLRMSEIAKLLQPTGIGDRYPGFFIFLRRRLVRSEMSILSSRLRVLLGFLLLVALSGSSFGNDYDFHGADELFAYREPESSDSHAEPEDEDEGSPEIVTVPQSPIGYEASCGIRNRGRKNPTNETRNASDNRIVGGAKATPGEFPWIVSIQLMSGMSARHMCGGSIVSNYWIVTAGHCIADLKPNAITVVAGEHDLFKQEGSEQRIKVSRIINGGYTEGDYSQDIAMLQLAKPIKMIPRKVGPICLPQGNKKYRPGEQAVVAGWGKLSENGDQANILHYANVPIISNSQCKKMYDSQGFGNHVNKCQICAGYEKGGIDACQGDSGGPLICKHNDRRYYLCGVVSFGVGCARPKLPGVYTETSCYISWIKNILYNVNNYVSNLPAYAN